MKISACVGFSKNAATTRQIMYMQKQAGDGFRIYLFDNLKSKNLVGCGKSKIFAPIKLFWKLLRDDADVFLIVKASPYTGFPVILAGILKRKKRVVLLDDYEKAITTERHGKFYGSIMGLIENLVISLSSGVISTSEFMYNKVKKKRKKLVPFGIPADRFKSAKEMRNKLSLKKSDKVLIYVGSLTKNADLDIAIKALPYVLKKNKDTKLLVVGDGENKDNFKKLTLHRGVSDNVIFTGFIEFSRVPDYIKSADINLIPMKDLDIDRGRCPMKLMEAIASEKPIVGGNVGMVKYFLNKEFLSKPGDEEDLARVVNKVLNSKKLREDWKKQAKKLKEEYSMKEIWKSNEEFLEQIVRG